ncbi:MAG TPA: hypothetical protein VF104_08970 [Burkholderiales bacterium]
MPADKIIVTNISALKAKYGKTYPRIQAAVDRLLAADRKRGLGTRVIALDSAADMRAVGGAAVTRVSDQRQTKAAIDAVCSALQPEYLMILGAPDIVAMQELANPMRGDGDEVVPSDLPYACAAPYSTSPRSFLGPTRVVGRLPDLVAKGDARYLVRLLSTAARYKSRARSDYGEYFGISAEVWKASTGLSLTKLFGASSAMETVPPKGPKWTDARLERRLHFINCHGGSSDPHYYGQPPKREVFPTAHSAKLLKSKISDGTVIAAECCYGAQLYDPADSEGQAGICSTYLYDGAYGFFGSTTVAYGPSEGNGQADLICQYFVEAVLGGASTGRAALEARQRFAAAYTHLDPSDLKTMAQFYLLGDPSVHPVSAVSHAFARSKAFGQAFKGAKASPGTRALRRERLVRTGMNLKQTLGAVEAARRQEPPAVKRVLAAAARESGLREVARESYSVEFPGGAAPGEMKRFEKARSRRSVHMLLGERGGGEGKVRALSAIIATVQDGELVHLRRIHRR